jgi:hypothetical protein
MTVASPTDEPSIAEGGKTKSYLKISYEANILTLITLVMSVGSLAWQTVNYLKGAETRLIPPEQVVIADSGAAKFPNRDGGPYVHFIARMSYVNTGAAGYNATIRAERVRVTVSGRQFEQNWFRYVHSDADSTEATKLVVDKVSEARPLPLTAGSAESHETLFQPWEKECPSSLPQCDRRENYIDWKTFLEWFTSSRKLELEFLADIYGRPEPILAKCQIEMEPEHVANLKARGWASPVCR